MDNIKEFLATVESMAKNYGIQNLFVIADNCSITRNSNNEAIRRCSLTLLDYEKEIGIDIRGGNLCI